MIRVKMYLLPSCASEGTAVKIPMFLCLLYPNICLVKNVKIASTPPTTIQTSLFSQPKLKMYCSKFGLSGSKIKIVEYIFGLGEPLILGTPCC